MAQTFRYPALLRLGGVTLTDESRQPLKEDRDERSVDVELASGKIKKYIKGIRRSWTVSWTNVAMTATDTVDGFGGRNEIRALAQNGGVLELIIQDGRNANETYQVYIEAYDDEVTMRRGAGDMFRYTVNLALKEVG